MNSILTELIKGLDTAPEQAIPGLNIIPVIHRGNSPQLFVSLHDALEAGWLEITEIDAGGHVPFIRAHNKGSIPILMLDGEELQGAKQNRILNVTVIVPGQSIVDIPVSCTEQGRWSYRSNHFHESGSMLPSRLRSEKAATVTQSLRERGSREGGQGQIWQGVVDFQMENASPSETSAMHDVYVNRSVDLDKSCRKFKRVEGQCGIYVEIDGKFAGLDLVAQPGLWKDLHDKVVRSYVIDVLNREHQSASVDPAWRDKLLAKLQEAASTEHLAVGLGSETRIESPELVGSLIQVEDEPVHAALYAHEARKPRLC